MSLISCNVQTEEPKDIEEEEFTVPIGESPYLDKLAISISSITGKTSLSTRDGDEESGESQDDVVGSFNPQDYIPYTLTFNNESVVFVSQMTNNVPAFSNEDVIYSFGYIPGSENASWDDDNSYNFTPNDEKDPLEWSKIGAAQTYHGGFSLYALYFPMSDKINQVTSEDNTIHYKVEQDQSILENLIKSDILGAYHSTEKLFTRIRFKMFHLMSYLRLRLYVPVYNDQLYTGFREGALESVILTNVTPEFAMNWTASISSDDQSPVVNALSGDNSIKMYQHPLEDGQSEHPIITVNYKKLLGEGYFDQGLSTDDDEVRVYDFSVLIPPQLGFVDNKGNPQPFTKKNFLHFYLYSNSGALKHYYFNQDFSANSTESNLNLTYGNFQLMEIYVPRVGNKAISVSAKVIPWNQRSSNFQLSQ